jgi:phage-related minor tail protein
VGGGAARRGGLKFVAPEFEFANGGIVTSPLVGLVGEAGPEAIIPLDRFDGMGGDTYMISVNVSGADPQAVVEALRRYTRANGPLGQVITV